MKAIIIGSGFAGMGMGIKLKEAGVSDFIILEKAATLGGTWRDNTYPGCGCDVMSHLYSFSFFLNPDWSRAFSGQEEIREYMERCADEFDIRKFMRFNAGVKQAEFREKSNTWSVTLEDGEQLEANYLIGGTGGLSIPSLPNIKGRDSFDGPSLHTAEWDKTVDISGKRVAVIGTGASAIQLIPSIADKVSALKVFQRTPTWVLPKPDREYFGFEKWLFRKLPFLMRLYRNMIYWRNELFATAFVRKTGIFSIPQWLANRQISKNIKDPELQKKLTPDFTLGCKRVLLSNDYYPALAKEQVDVITEGIDHIFPKGIVTKDGVEHEVDVVVYATGFKATEYLSNVKMIGKNGQTLSQTWERDPDAYLGTTVAGFPNLFLMGGPNTGIGHTSMVYILESQMAYIVDALKQLESEAKQFVEIKPEAQQAFNKEVQKAMQKTIWKTGQCNSWYLHPVTGKNVTLWPDYTFKFRKKTRTFDANNYITR